MAEQPKLKRRFDWHRSIRKKQTIKRQPSYQNRSNTQQNYALTLTKITGMVTRVKTSFRCFKTDCFVSYL